MAYILKSQIAAELPPKFLLEALDDDGDGIEDAGLWDQIEASAAESIDGVLGQRFSVPFPAPIPAIVAAAARIFVLEKLYFRRGLSPNPWENQAKEIRAKLNLIAAGEEPLTPGIDRKKPSVSAITESAKTTSSAESIAY